MRCMQITYFTKTIWTDVILEEKEEEILFYLHSLSALFHYSLDGSQLVWQQYMKRDTPKETKWNQYQSAYMVNFLSNQSE